MLLHAVDNKILSPEVIDETILSIKRAGASRIITYFVPRLLSPQGGHCEP
jgi:delta-aminolevulinic acid dehydratase/porphobilinogen synthase